MYAIAADRASLSLLLYNFAAVGTLLVFWTALGLGASPPNSNPNPTPNPNPNPRPLPLPLPLTPPGASPPRQLQQGYLVIVSGLIAWSATHTPIPTPKP